MPTTQPPPPRREVLPETRRSQTHKFCIGGHEGYLTIGLFDDGRPGEIFIKMSKEGSTLSGLIQGFCRAFSLCLQHGLALEDAVERFRGMRFEPLGPTTNPEIPECSSILDYVARYLDREYSRRGLSRR
jgi:ribonucleoside-diphosphate reductase alpha chain